YLQVLMIALLALVPRREGPVATTSRLSDIPLGWLSAMQGLAAGIGVTLGAGAIGALIFGTYCFGIFGVSPFLIGAMTGYFVNRRADVGQTSTVGWALLATLLGGVSLVVVALEGVVCLVMAAPLTLCFAVFGAALGRAVALAFGRSARSA